LPTTWPHFEVADIYANTAIQTNRVTLKNTVSECVLIHLKTGFFSWTMRRLQSGDPRSYRIRVQITVATTPLQSAMAFPKNDPQCVSGFDGR
jgi:hypothetical protein